MQFLTVQEMESEINHRAIKVWSYYCAKLTTWRAKSEKNQTKRFYKAGRHYQSDSQSFKSYRLHPSIGNQYQFRLSSKICS